MSEVVNSYTGLITAYTGVAISYIALIYALYYENILRDYGATNCVMSSIQQNTGFETDGIDKWGRCLARRYWSFCISFWALLCLSGTGILGTAVIATGDIVRYTRPAVICFIWLVTFFIFLNGWAIWSFRRKNKTVLELSKKSDAMALENRVGVPSAPLINRPKERKRP